MKEVIQFGILGLGPGAVYCLLGQGVVLVYRGSGVVNFAQGAIAMVGGFLFYTYGVESNLPTPVALSFALAMSVLVGALVYGLVMRPLRNASSLARQMATLAVVTVLTGIGIRAWTGDGYARVAQSILPTNVVEVGDVTVSIDRALLVLIAGLLTLALWWVFRRTTIGLATAAGAEHPLNISLLGWSPSAVALATWCAGAGLAGLSGILIGPIAGLDVRNLTFLIIPALAATLLANFRSFPVLLAASLVLGVVEAETSYYANVFAGRAVSFVAIVLVLVVRGRGLPVRGELADRLPALGSGQIRLRPLLVATAVAALLVGTVASVELVTATTYTAAVGVLVLSVVVVTGYAGQISLAQYAIGGLGALVAGMLVESAGVTFILAMLGGVVVAMLGGVVFAIPALRTRGVNLAVVTLGLGAAVEGSVFANDTFVGHDGIIVGPQRILWFDIDAVLLPRNYSIFAIVCFVIVAVGVANLRRSRAGRRLIAVRGNERAAASLGISVVGAKVFAFAFGAAIASIGGILLGFRAHSVLLGEFRAFDSILLISYAMIGGIGYVLAPLFGAALTPSGLAPALGDYVGLRGFAILAGGIGMVLVLKWRPDGLASLVDRRRRGGATASTPLVLAEVERRRVPEATLEVRDISVVYGVTRALSRASLQVASGQVVGLIGANGAGKTTFLDAVTGITPMAEGTVLLNGKSIDRWSVSRRSRSGLGRSFQALELFEELTVGENLQVACDDGRLRAYASAAFWPGRAPLSSAAVAAVRDFGLEAFLDAMPPALPNGIRHQVAVARAVAQEPMVLLLDEPAAGLDETESAELASLVRQLADAWGIAVVLIEHDMSFVMRVCDRITVLDFGEVIAEGTPAEIQADPAVIAAYLGGDEAVDGPALTSETASPVAAG